MRESRFIHSRKESWKHHQKIIDDSSIDPEALSEAYLEILDDLSYSRTHYPNRYVRTYLNGLAQALGLKIFKTGGFSWKKIKEFWTQELPFAAYQSRKRIGLAFIVFGFFMLIGFLSVQQDLEFAKSILGPDYIAMTEANIEKGDPMSVYKDQNMSSMFLGITLNNTRVASYTYSLGFTAGIGCLLILLYNGIMVGVFQGYFIERDLFWESFLTIWQHGVVEISMIILSAAAGFELASGILFPKDMSRLDSIRASGRRSIRLMLGIIPLLIYSGFIEAFITRLTDLPFFIRFGTIVISMAGVLYYFWIFPWLKFRHNKDNLPEAALKPIESYKFQRNRIEGLAHILQFSLLSILSVLQKNWYWFILLLAIPFGLEYYWSDTIFYENIFFSHFQRNDLGGEAAIWQMFSEGLIGVTSFLIALIAFRKASEETAKIRWSIALPLMLFHSMIIVVMSKYFFLMLAYLFVVSVYAPVFRFLIFRSDSEKPQVNPWNIAMAGLGRSLGVVSIISIFLMLLFILHSLFLRDLLTSFNTTVLPFHQTIQNVIGAIWSDLLPNVIIALMYAWMVTSLFIYTYSYEIMITSSDLRSELDDFFPDEEKDRGTGRLLGKDRFERL